MKNKLRNLILPLIIVMTALHIYIFINGIRLSDDINFYENEISRLHRENLELTKQANSFDSLQYAASMAAVMDFTKTAQPVYLEDVTVARK